MAFSTAQQTYVDTLVNTLYSQGYKYYVAYTHTQINSGYYTQTEPDLYIVFSKDVITGTTGYTYLLDGEALLYTIRTGGYTTSQYGVNTDRVSVSNYSSGTVSIDLYEHIYTNAKTEGVSIQPDIRYLNGGENLEKTNGVGLAVMLALLVAVAFTMFRGR